MARRGLGFLALLLALLPGLGRAGGSLEARVSGGSGVSSVGGTASLDLGTRWTLDVSDDYIDVSSTGAPSRTDEASLGLAYADGGAWQSKVGVDYSNDWFNLVAFAGPSFGVTYTQAAPERPASGDNDDSDAEGGDAWSLTFDATIHGYQVDLGANATQAKTRAGVPYSLVNNHGTQNLTQFDPSLSLDLPCFGAWTNLTLSYGQDFYNRDPVLVATIINHRLTVGNGSGRVGTLVGALYTDTVSVACTQRLGWGLSLGLNGTDSQLVSPSVWAQGVEASLGVQLGKSFNLKAGWTNTYQGNAQTPGLEASGELAF